MKPSFIYLLSIPLLILLLLIGNIHAQTRFYAGASLKPRVCSLIPSYPEISY
jgi:hypothetical protein